MISYYPNQYIDGATVKARIQVTSRPIPPDNNGLPSPDNDKINAGIVDPILALLDPSKHWLKQSGAWRQAKIKAVSAGPFAYQDPNNKQYIDTTSIRRVYKMPRNRWAIYTDNALMNAEVPPGDVKRFGPLVSVANEKLVQLCDSNWLRLQDVDDFIVAKQGLHANVCP
jgi:hypothetical protein